MTTLSHEQEILPGYHLIKRIGSGGYGDVWEARAPGDLPKAVKVLYGRFDEKRAESELKSLRRIREVRHPFLLSIERIEVVNDQLVVVSELADGCLKDRFDECQIAGQPGIPRHELFNYLAEAADVLDFMVAKFGLQHLDIKPENILLIGGHAKVADFGLVRDIHGGTQSLQGGLTPAYAPPEMFDGRPCEHSDQYSLAIVYQRMLTGTSPFSGETMAQLTAQHMHTPPDVSPLHPGDHTAVLRALSKDPYERFPTCRAFIESLRSSSQRNAPVFHSSAPRKADPGVGTDPVQVDEATGPINENHCTTTNLGHRPTRDTVELDRYEEVTELPPILDEPPLALRNTLYISLGHFGWRTLCRFQAHLECRFGQLTALPAFRYLAIDTEPLCHDYRDEELGPVEERTRERQRERTYLQLPLKPTEYYREQAPKLLGWLSRRWIYNIPRSRKTGGLRPLGRLALVDHIVEVRHRIEQEINALHDESVANETSRQTGLQVDDQGFRVVIVGSLSGGTSSGMIWDLAQIIRSVCDQQQLSMPEILTVATHHAPKSNKEKELAIATTCASLGELAHYQMQGYPGDPACGLPPASRRERLFDQVYLLDSTDLCPSHEAYDLAEILLADAVTKAAPYFSGCRQTPTGAKKEKATIRTIGKSTLTADELRTVNRLVALVASQIVKRWAGTAISPQRDASEHSSLAQTNEPQRFAETTQISKDSLHQITRALHSLASDIDAAVKSHYFNQTAPKVQGETIRNQLHGLDTINNLNRPSSEEDILSTMSTKLINERLAMISKTITYLIDQPQGRFTSAQETLKKALEVVDKLVADYQQRFEQIAANRNAMLNSQSEDLSGEQPANASPEVLARYADLSQQLRTHQLQHEAFTGVAQQLRVLQARLADSQKRVLAIATQLGELSDTDLGDDLEAEAVLRKLNSHTSADTDTSALLDQLATKTEQQLARRLAQQPTSLAAMLLAANTDRQQLSKFLIEHTRRSLLSTLAKTTIAAAESRFLACGGARRFFVCVGEDNVSQMMFQLLLRELKTPPTIIPVDEPGVSVFCEAEQVPVASVAALIAEQREDFLEAATRLRTRVDVNWSSF